MDSAMIEGVRTKLERETTPGLRAMLSGLDAGGWEPEALEVAAEILAERGIDPDRTMARCPICEGELEQGTVRVHGTLLGFLFFGLSYQRCWFRSSATGKEDLAVHWSKSHAACRCRACGLLMVAGERG
jgi:hypothetical protein